MQRCLNRIDGVVCNHNIIISRLPKKDIIMESDVSSPIINDHEKISWILRYMGTDHFDEGMVNNFNITRLGKEKTEYNRIVKFRLSSVNDRDKFLKNAKKLKDAPGPWGKVYLTKDQHPSGILRR